LWQTCLLTEDWWAIIGYGSHQEYTLSHIPGAASSQFVSLPNYDGAQQPLEIEMASLSTGVVISWRMSSMAPDQHPLIFQMGCQTCFSRYYFFKKLRKPLLITINVIGSKPSQHHIHIKEEAYPCSVNICPLSGICKLAASITSCTQFIAKWTKTFVRSTKLDQREQLFLACTDAGRHVGLLESPMLFAVV
jgi:hypothetical protein